MTASFLLSTFLHLFRCDPRECYESSDGVMRCTRCERILWEMEI